MACRRSIRQDPGCVALLIPCRGPGGVRPSTSGYGTVRDVAAAKAFFRKAIKSQLRPPQTITLDGYAASHRAVHELKVDGSLPPETKLRSSKYLNNLIEQYHRGVKQRVAAMQGFKQLRNCGDHDRRH